MLLIDDPALQRLAQRISPGSRLRRAWPMRGGISARMTALELEQPGAGMKRWIVREPGEDALRRSPAAATDEFRLLQILSASGLPVPVPHSLDESSEILPAPYLVVEYIEGAPVIALSDLDDPIFRLAAQLAEIHALQRLGGDLSFVPRQTDRLAQSLAARPSVLNDAMDEGRIRRTLEPVWPLPSRNEPALLHGDFWPGNILCREGRIAAVIDWEEAKIGDPLYDVATSRLDLLWAFGIDAMQEFTARYQAMTDVDLTGLPYWDLFAALRPIQNIGEWAQAWSALGRPDLTEASMRDGHRRFVAQALENLGLGDQERREETL
jgi:aminoglycoside phosphotransferase (APT) family kinase protein